QQYNAQQGATATGATTAAAAIGAQTAATQQLTAAQAQNTTQASRTAQAQHAIGEYVTSEDIRDGTMRQQELTRAYADTGEVVSRTKTYYDQHGKEVGSLVTEYKKLENGMVLVRQNLEGTAGAVRGGNVGLEQFGRHLMWIGQGIALWGGINAVTSAVKQWADAQAKLNAALGEFEMRTGANEQQIEQFKEQVRAVSIETATKP